MTIVRGLRLVEGPRRSRKKRRAGMERKQFRIILTGETPGPASQYANSDLVRWKTISEVLREAGNGTDFSAFGLR